MTYDPAQGGRKPAIVPIKTWDLLALPIIGPWLCRLLGGGIGPRKDLKKAKGG
jgi:hypothetical protein